MNLRAMHALILTERYSNSESPLLKEQRDLINRLMTEKKANEDKYIQLQETIQSVQVHSHFQALSPSISRDTASTTSTAYDPSTEINEYYSLFKDLLERVDACKYTLETNRHQRIHNGVMDVHLAEEELFPSVDRQKLSQVVQGDPVLEFRSTQLKKKKANKAQPPLFGGGFGFPTSSSSQSPFSRQDNAADKPDGQKPQLSLFGQLPAASEPSWQKEQSGPSLFGGFGKPSGKKESSGSLFGGLPTSSSSQNPFSRQDNAADKPDGQKPQLSLFGQLPAASEPSEQKESAGFSESATGPSNSPEITSPSSAYTPSSPAPTHKDLSHANTPENHGLLPPQSSGDWESHDRVSSEDDVSDVVDDVLLEWTTIERGELPGQPLSG